MGKPRTPPFKHWPKWSEARFRQFVRSALRAAYNKYPVKYAALDEAKRKYRGDNKRRKWEYQCAECKGWFKSTEVQVDHIIPAGSALKSWDEFIVRLFCGLENLQVVCISCHKIKCAKEREEGYENITNRY